MNVLCATGKKARLISDSLSLMSMGLIGTSFASTFLTWNDPFRTSRGLKYR